MSSFQQKIIGHANKHITVTDTQEKRQAIGIVFEETQMLLLNDKDLKVIYQHIWKTKGKFFKELKERYDDNDSSNREYQ